MEKAGGFRSANRFGQSVSNWPNQKQLHCSILSFLIKSSKKPGWINVVRFVVKDRQQDEVEHRFRKAPIWKDQLLHVLAKTGQNTYVGSGLWESEEAMIAA